MLLGIEEGTSQKVFRELEAKGMIVDNKIANWEKRQPKKEDPTNTDRSRKYRAKTKKSRNAMQRDETNETLCNAIQRDETLGNARKDKNIQDKDQKIKTHVRSAERTSADDAHENPDPLAENPSEDGGAREKDGGRGIEYTTEFEEFWSEYPRRVRKKDAFKHWTPVIAIGSSAAEIVAAAKAYAAAMRYLERAPDKIMHPQTFIMADRWRYWLPPDGQEYLDAQETYRMMHSTRQPRAQPQANPNRYSQYNEVVWDGSDRDEEEDGTT